MRGTRPFVLSNLHTGEGVDTIVRFVQDSGGLRAS
jgi:Ni2+-binding GTPase involved in maturation of urease and hydrogenase